MRIWSKLRAEVPGWGSAREAIEETVEALAEIADAGLWVLVALLRLVLGVVLPHVAAALIVLLAFAFLVAVGLLAAVGLEAVLTGGAW